MTGAVDDLIRRLPILAPTRESIEHAIVLAIEALRGGGKLLVCGNGGSASDSEHLVADLVKGFMSPRPISAAERAPLVQLAGSRGADIADRLQGSLAAASLVSQAALATAISNDVHFDMVFAQQVFGLGQPRDVLVAISTSGASPSVINAAVVARARSMAVIALTGRDGGELAGLADVAIRVPADRVYEIQELHLPVYHALALALEQEFFGDRADDDQAQLQAPMTAGGR